MKSNYTHLILILDKSGSMGLLQSATIEGVNSLVAKQKEMPGDFTTAVYTFDGSVDEVAGFSTLTPMNYTPYGSTALLDAFCHAVDSEGSKLFQMKESDRPDKVVVVVVTDGEENASHKHSLTDVKNRITTQEHQYAWKFVFLGANIDAFKVGQSYGFMAQGTLQWTPTFNGVKDSYATVCTAMASYRSGASDTVNVQEADKTTV
jgi:uncharacterized protein YegL